jgi:putative hydrolase of the HAD superfamily
VSFDLWDTLFSVASFYRSVSAELSRISNKQQTVLERKLNEGYKELVAVRRTGGFKDSQIVSMTLEAISDILEVDADSVKKAVLQAVTKISPEEYVIIGAREALEMVKSSNLETAIIGNVVFWPGSCNRTLLEKADLAKLIGAQFYADEAGVSKPDRDMFSLALLRFSVKPEEALHVGNSVFEDFAGAVLSGMNAVLIDRNVDGPIRLSELNAYLTPTIGSLESIVKELL